MSKTATQTARGTRDFLPHDMRRRNHVARIIREVYEAHGFEPLQTPALERLSTLLGKYGEEEQLLFKVLLRGQPLLAGIRASAEHLAEPGAIVSGRSGDTAPGAEPLLSDMGLRYDLTVPLARVYAAHQGKIPAIFKRYQIQPVWRADTPGKGRYREFMQCDVDVIGASSLASEAEVVGAACQCLSRLGFDAFRVRFNHRQLLSAIIDKAGVPGHQATDAIVALDKLDKVGPEGVARELEARGIEAAAAKRLLDIAAGDARLEQVASQLEDHPEGRRAADELRTLLQLASVTPAAERLQFDASLARGLNYYTGCIFEIQVADLAGAIGAGGRYDGLIGMFSSRAAPACGISLGFERILVVMEQRGMFPNDLASADVIVAPVHEDEMRQALSLAARLRAGGRRVELRPQATKPGKLRREAEQRGIAYAAWIERGGVDRAGLWARADGAIHGDVSFEELRNMVS